VGVILATFIVKDELRDEEKDAVSALETAQREYNSRHGTDEILNRIQSVTEQIDSLTNSKADPKFAKSELDDKFDSLSLSQGRLAKLLESLPEEDANETIETGKLLERTLVFARADFRNKSNLTSEEQRSYAETLSQVDRDVRSFVKIL
jgi:hypothetical protein